MTDLDGAALAQPKITGAIRAAMIGLLQGLAIYLLLNAAQAKAWPATDPALFAPLCTTAIFVPLILVSGLTNLQARTLGVWSVVAALICIALTSYDIDRYPLEPWSVKPRMLPSPQLWFGLALGLFIAHCQIVAAAIDRRWIARYQDYFAIAWKFGLQAALASLFAALFWGVLWLGADLFMLIKISVFVDIIHKSWFWIPATTVALTCALHVTDVRAGIVRSVRTIACNLLAWLLPLLALIAVGFAAALPFTGLEPLWDTKRASAILLIAVASLIFLINAAFQDGTQLAPRDATPPLPRLLRGAIIAASLALPPLVALVAYALALRIDQYGWSQSRVVATFCTLVAACYATGYVAAALRWRTPAPVLAATNVATSFVILACLLALLTPLADPARIAVADQVRRLNAGLITPEKFDYLHLRFDTGRYGVDALQALTAQQSLPIAAQKAAEALKRKTRLGKQQPISRAERDRQIIVAQPPGASLPREFLETVWSNEPQLFLLPECLTAAGTCDAVLVDLDGDGIAEIILQPPVGPATVFRSVDNHAWRYLGTLAGSNCTGVRDALVAGSFRLAAPEQQDLDLSGHRLHLERSVRCPPGTDLIKKN